MSFSFSLSVSLLFLPTFLVFFFSLPNTPFSTTSHLVQAASFCISHRTPFLYYSLGCFLVYPTTLKHGRFITDSKLSFQRWENQHTDAAMALTHPTKFLIKCCLFFFLVGFTGHVLIDVSRVSFAFRISGCVSPAL